MASPIPRASVPDHVFAQLREAIILGRYLPGERLPPQRALAAELEVNMASAREALKRLEQLRLVEVRHGDGTRVLDWRRSGCLEALVLRGGIDQPFVRDLFEARRLLLVEAARLAAVRRSDEQARSLRELADAVASAGDDGARLRADWAFMAGLVESAGNLVFQLIMNSVRELYLERAEAFTALVAEGGSLTGLYARAAAAVQAADPEAAATAIDTLAAAQAAAMLT
ncbi:MAG: FadR family transcriptional regulator [Actinobacteria bacterium]|nr:MAG: FadR family transcriptional regulator [Actinomycetota bacterium]